MSYSNIILPFTYHYNINFSFKQSREQQEDQTSKQAEQAGPKSQPDPKGKKGRLIIKLIKIIFLSKMKYRSQKEE